MRRQLRLAECEAKAELDAAAVRLCESQTAATAIFRERTVGAHHEAEALSASQGRTTLLQAEASRTVLQQQAEMSELSIQNELLRREVATQAQDARVSAERFERVAEEMG